MPGGLPCRPGDEEVTRGGVDMCSDRGCPVMGELGGGLLCGPVRIGEMAVPELVPCPFDSGPAEVSAPVRLLT
jgi:hypothetical protein